MLAFPLQAQWAQALMVESQLLHKQLAQWEEVAGTSAPADRATTDPRAAVAAPAADQPPSDLTSDQQLRILKTCASTAERRAKQVEDELKRVCTASSSRALVNNSRRCPKATMTC